MPSSMPQRITFMGKRETKEDDDIGSLDPSSTGWTMDILVRPTAGNHTHC